MVKILRVTHFHSCSYDVKVSLMGFSDDGEVYECSRDRSQLFRARHGLLAISVHLLIVSHEETLRELTFEQGLVVEGVRSGACSGEQMAFCRAWVCFIENCFQTNTVE